MIGIFKYLLEIIATLLKDYVPEWRKRRVTKKDSKDIYEVSNEILEGDDIGLSVRMSDEFDRVRSEQAGRDDTAK